MLRLLLDASHNVNGMTDVVFGVKDLVTIGGGVVATLTAYFALKYGQKANEKEMANINEKLIAIKNGKHAMKKELERKEKEDVETIHKRIDKTQEDFKSSVEKNRVEFGKINETMSEVKQGTAEIKGMIQTLLNK